MQFLTKKYLTIVGFFCLTLSVSAQNPNKFPYEKSSMPFNAPPVERKIDKGCSDKGKVSVRSKNGAEQEAQNQAKNNFGVTGTPIPIQIADFDRLEKASLLARICWKDKKTGCKKLPLKGGLPINREDLKDITTSTNGDTIGEGTLVTLEAKILESHYSNTKYNKYGSDTGSGESVNCQSREVDNNDIHICLKLFIPETAGNLNEEQWTNWTLNRLKRSGEINQNFNSSE